MSNTSKKVSFEIIKKTAFPFIIFLIFLASHAFYKVQISPYVSSQLQSQIKKYSLTILIGVIIFIVQRMIGGIVVWYKDQIAAKTATKLDDEMVPLISRTLKIIVWTIALLLILPLYGVNISALVATLGISSLAIALAAQDTIANIIAGFLIMIDKPFRVGDQIKLPSGEVVDVLEIGVRRSKFLAQDSSIVIMPNLELSKSKIINYTYGQELKR